MYKDTYEIPLKLYLDNSQDELISEIYSDGKLLIE